MTPFVDKEVWVRGDLCLHLTDWNESADKVAVLLHGLSVQGHTWDPIAEDLVAAGYRVICPDLRGHGLSDWADDYHLRSFVDDLEAVVEHLGLVSFDLIGHSFGCRVAIVYAGEHPEIVRHLVLSDAGPEVPKQAIEFSENVTVSPVRGFRTEEEALAYYRKIHPEWQERFLDLHVQHQLRRNWAGKLVFRSDPETLWLLGSAGSKDNEMVWRGVDALSMPGLVMWGERSTFFTEELANRMISRMADGRLVRTDTGHYIPREDPEAFLRAVHEFLGTPDSSERTGARSEAGR